MKKKKPQPENQEQAHLSPSELEKQEKVKRDLVFDPNFLEDLTYWVKTSRKTALRLLSLVAEIERTPFEGTGKLEPLKYKDANIWSRRLTEKDRIVYVVDRDRIEFLQGRYHYGDR
ncbi:MAG: Txe/YoeB family addiction module toxin [Spirulina sp.]